ncbi:MAG: DUF1365 domain-containing protein [Actinomycetota bacterium]|nr:DUF1365 domain-containing protein [Actinomycetota bacterium]
MSTASPVHDMAPARAQGPVTPRLYATSVRHVRREPVRHDFTLHSYTWLVDLDALPDLGRLTRLASFEARDHLERDAPGSLRQKVDAFLATQGVDLQGGRIVMLAQARVGGYVFNPISLYWCHRRDGALECVVLEVQNTYGDRHAYLVRTDQQGRARTEKELYVSPFNDVDGHYDLVLPEPDERLRTSVVLQREGSPPFVAVMSGRAHDVTTARLLRISLTRPLEPLAVMARIKAHGILLWLRRLPVRPRPPHRQEAVQ